jgi:hypothetical protein
MGEIRNVVKRHVRKLQVRTLCGRPGHRWGAVLKWFLNE